MDVILLPEPRECRSCQGGDDLLLFRPNGQSPWWLCKTCSLDLLNSFMANVATLDCPACANTVDMLRSAIQGQEAYERDNKMRVLPVSVPPPRPPVHDPRCPLAGED